MNVFLVADYAAPYEGNFMNSIKKLEEKIRQNKGEMLYSFPEKAKEIGWIQELGKTRKVYFHTKNVKENGRNFRKIIKENSVDMIYSHFCIGRTQAALKMVSQQNRVKLVQHYHNHYQNQMPQNPVKRMFLKYIFQGDLNIGCSESVAQSIPYKKVVAVPNAIAFERLEQWEKVKLAEDNQTVILMFGFDYERKGVDIAIKALQEVAEKYNLVLAISVSVKLEQLKQKIMDEFGEIPEFVKFLEPRDDIATYYHASDIFLSAAREEGFCYAIVEAVYCQTQCICSNLKAQPLEIPNLRIFQSENVEDLREKIVQVLECGDLNKKDKKIESCQFVKEKYAIEYWANSIYEHLRRIAK